MNDPYSVLGIQPGASEDEIKKAYRSKCKQYHPDLHPNDPTAEARFKDVQAAYSEIMKIQQGGGASSYGGYSQQSSGYGYSGYGRQQYQDPFGGFGFNPFGSYGYSQSSYGTQQESDTRMQAARNYINARHYQEALYVLENIPVHERRARWYYFAALAHSGLGNRINALEYAKKAVELDPGSYEYQNLVDRLQNYSRSYQNMNSSYQVHNFGTGNWCLSMLLLNLFCNFCCWGC